MFDRNAQLKIMLVGLSFSTAVACVCVYAKAQPPAQAGSERDDLSRR